MARPQSVTVTYTVGKAGWADATFRIGERTVTFRPGYLSDAFGDLVGATATIAEALAERHASQQRVEWFGEPLGLDISIRAYPDATVWLEFVQVPDEFERKADRSVIWSGPIDFHAFAQSVRREADRLLVDLGTEGYLARWTEHEFPTERLSQLKKHLESETA